MKSYKIGTEDIRLLADFLLKNRNDVQIIIDEFGEVSSNNGYGTIFLIPQNPVFKTFWVYEKENKLGAIGFGGPGLGLKLKDIYSVYLQYTEAFSRYDDSYVYTFVENDNYTYRVQFYSKNRLLEEGKMLENIDVDSLEIWLK
jgi:hypothetical protein